MVKLLAVLGDYYHPEEWAKESLEHALQSLPSVENIQIDYCGYDSLQAALTQQPDGVILFKENRLNPTDEIVEEWMTDEMASNIASYVKNGGGWLAWHSGLASYPENGSYTKMLKGYFLHHPNQHQVVQYTLHESEINLRTNSFAVLDEHYFVHCDEEGTNIFLTAESIDGHAIAGWSHPYGDGRVCCLTPSHNKEGLLNTDFINLLASCVNWVISR